MSWWGSHEVIGAPPGCYHPAGGSPAGSQGFPGRIPATVAPKRGHGPPVPVGCGFFHMEYIWYIGNGIYIWVVPSLLQTVNPVIIKNTKKYKKIQLQITKKYNTEQGKIINKRKIQHTLMDSRFCSLTACLKNAKNTKGQSAICEGLEKYKKIQKYKLHFWT